VYQLKKAGGRATEIPNGRASPGERRWQYCAGAVETISENREKEGE